MSEASSPQAPTAVATAPIVLVAGMHRSGTSLVGLLLDRIGVPVPGELIGADVHNQSGYFERADITDLQEKLLIELGRWWPSEAGAAPLAADLPSRPAWSAARQRLQELLRLESGRQAQPWAIKDPRTSLLLPLWRQVADDLRLDLRLVLCVRDPAEVMVSLVHRDAESTGMTPWRAQRLWWLHQREFLQSGAGLPTLILHYDDWFDPRRARRQLNALAAFCGREALEPAAIEAALAAVRPEQRRSRRRADALPLPVHPLLLRLDRRLHKLARPEPVPAARLSRSLGWIERHTPELERSDPAAPSRPRPQIRLRPLERVRPWRPRRRADA